MHASNVKHTGIDRQSTIAYKTMGVRVGNVKRQRFYDKTG